MLPPPLSALVLPEIRRTWPRPGLCTALADEGKVENEVEVTGLEEAVLPLFVLPSVALSL